MSMSVVLMVGIAWPGSALRAEEAWSFPVIADWHAAEVFIYESGRAAAIQDRTTDIKLIHTDAGGDFALLPGDTQGGHWDTEDFIGKYNPGGTPAETIRKAGTLCARGIQQVFQEAGYPKIILAMGDHEVGDNDWHAGGSKARNLHVYRKSFSDVINCDAEGAFIHDEAIGGVPSRPLGTFYENTSYAFVHKNALIVTLDAFHMEDPNRKISKHGAVVGAVRGKHLEWLEAVLQAARKDDRVKHIFVQSHLPGMLPVRILNSSAMSLDGNAKSELWQVMRKYGVDLYFAGEVHANTATRDTGSDLVQVVSRGNRAEGFVNVTVADDTIQLAYRRRGKDDRFHTEGQITIDKSSGKTRFDASGVLTFVDLSKALVHYPFEPEDIMPFEASPFNHNEGKGFDLDKNSMLCNRGHWGMNMSAFTDASDFKAGIKGKALVFDGKAAFVSYGMSPTLGNDPRTVSLWINTTSDDPMYLFSIGNRFGSSKSLFSLQLDQGNLRANQRTGNVTLTAEAVPLNDGSWHMVSAVLPEGGTYMEDLRLFVDGKPCTTSVSKKQVRINTRACNILGVGTAGRPGNRDAVRNFTGLIDEFNYWAIGLKDAEILKRFEACRYSSTADTGR
jgi:hypothetical protein